MLAIEIRYNGELKAPCGAEVFKQLTAMFNVTNTETTTPVCEVECLGLVPRDEETDEVLRWVKKKIEFGDEIAFRVIHTETSQAPFDSQVIPKHGAPRG